VQNHLEILRLEFATIENILPLSLSLLRDFSFRKARELKSAGRMFD
jgi:hypothetical protein